MKEMIRIKITNEIRNKMRNKMRNEMRNDVLFEKKILSVIVNFTSSFLMRVVLIFSNSKNKYV
jgi:hypothetical protein